MSKLFNQTNSDLKFGDGTVKASGCGICASACIISNLDSSVSIKSLGQEMYNKGEFVGASGTTRTGITNVLKRHGFRTIYTTPEDKDTESLRTMFAMMRQSNNKSGADLWMVLLMHGKSLGGKDNYWTSGGHFIVVSAYYEVPEKYYVFDSAMRNNGWHDESEFIGDVAAAWLVCPN